MSYNYSHLQQGYRGAGGVPYNGMPTLPSIATSKKMEEHLPAIGSAIYADMNRRNTSITSYLANAMAVNTYHNETFKLALQLSADYVEYLLGAKLLPLPQAINTAVPLINDYICFNYIAQTYGARELASQQEMSVYSAAAEKIKSLKPEIKNYLTRGDTNMYPQQQFMQQQPPMGYPQQQFMPQQAYGQPVFPSNPNNPNGAAALLSRALARNGVPAAPAPQQFMQQQPPMGYPQQQFMPQQMGMGYPQQGFPPGFNPAMASMNNTAQMVQQVWGQPQMPQQAYNPAAFATSAVNQPANIPQNQPVQGYPASVQNGGNMWTANPNLMNNSSSAQQSQTRLASQSYVPDMSGIKRPQQPQAVQNTQPVQQNRNVQPQPNFSQQVKRPQTENRYIPQPSPPGTLVVDRDLIEYENKVREFAKEKGLPWNDHSVEALEWAISNMYPDNGFIDPNNPYRLRCMPKNQQMQSLANRQEVSNHIQKSADDDLKEMASKSKGELVKDAKGNYVWLSETGNPNSAVNKVSITSSPEAIRNYVANGNAAPYPFARLNSKGEWFINEAEFNSLPKDKRPSPYDGAIARCLMRDLYFVVDNNGKVIKDFSVVKPEYQQEYEEIIMNKEQHDYNRFFSPQTKRDLTNEIDYTQAIEAFANAQTQSKVRELIRELEADSNAVKENGVLQISDRTLQSNQIVVGEIMGDDYVSRAQSVIEELVEDKAEISNCAVRYVHVNLSGQLQTGEVANILPKMLVGARDRISGNGVTWNHILAVFNELDEFTNTGILTVLNQRATNFINQQLISVFNIYPTEFYMESFMLDILDVEEAMAEKGLVREFNRLAGKLALSLLFCFDESSHLFKEVIGSVETEDKDAKFVTFGIVRDVTVLPIHSNYISLNSEKRRAVVTEGSAPQLYKLIKHTLDTAHPRAAEVMLVTTDNRIMYVNRTANSKAFAVTQDSVLEETKF